jgi:16S rRNA (cytosine967-C5)-methyltransferase
MISQFRLNHILNFFRFFDENPNTPLDLNLRNYFKNNRAIGSKDRKIIGDAIYDVIRFKGLLDANIDGNPCWEKRVELYQIKSVNELKNKSDLNQHERVSFDKVFFDLLTKDYGLELAREISETLNTTAPIHVRANTLKISRDDLIERLKPKFEVTACKESLEGIEFHKKINFFELEEFKNGYFEIQDEASQLVANYADVNPGDEILDYCAGAGGKTLALAPKLKGKGQIFLHDIRKNALENAKIRLKRAGIQNYQIHLDLPKNLKNRMNLVFVDAPCTGSGTWRRNPDQKWKFSSELLKRIVNDQRDIFEKALSFLGSKGKILYATCSILSEENEEQVEYFCKKFGLKLTKPIFKTLPKVNEKDGFFAALLEKTCQV